MKWLFLAALVGCMPDQSNTIGVNAHLPSDGHYLFVQSIYASVDACLAANDNPWSCSFTITLCANGKAAHRQGDTIDDGTYALDGEIALLTLRNELFDFDVATLTRVDDGEQWQIDAEQRYLTQEFDSISCE